MSGLSYHSRLKALNLESLELRRLRADLLLAYKILFGLLRVNSDKFFTPRNQSRLLELKHRGLCNIYVIQTAMFQL